MKNTLLHASALALLLVAACGSDGAPPCDTSADCRGGEVCRENRCLEACSATDPCEGSRGACLVAEGICVECVTGADCDAGEICDVTRNRCQLAECATDVDCAGGQRCTGGACASIDGGCTRNADCAGGEMCQRGACVPIGGGCTSDGDCAGGERCAGGACVPIGAECALDSDCPGGEMCDAGSCVPATPECSRDADCAGGQRCVGGSCEVIATGCTGDGDCGGGESCVGGSCVAMCTSASDCRLVAPQCGCPGSQACDLDLDTRGHVCRAAGSGSQGTVCAAETDCRTGATCLGVIGGGTSMCMDFCNVDSDCRGGGLCALAARDAAGMDITEVGICSQPCNPLTSAGCPSGTACSIIGGIRTTGEGITACRAITAFPFPGLPCTDDTFCSAGEHCAASACAAYCRVGRSDCATGTCAGFDTAIRIDGVEWGTCG